MVGTRAQQKETLTKRSNFARQETSRERHGTGAQRREDEENRRRPSPDRTSPARKARGVR